jgi:hypothetical protein
MNEIHDSIDETLSSLDKLKKFLKKSSTKQVQGQEEKSITKANASAWFNKHRVIVSKAIDEPTLVGVDRYFNQLLELTDKSGARSKYFDLLTNLKSELVALRSRNIIKISSYVPKSVNSPVPNFSKIIPDTEMQEILKRRWAECEKCVIAQVPLAATVMIGGLIETILLARLNTFDQSKVFTAKTAPKDKTSGKTLQLKEWTLKNYIEVTHELGIISQTGKDVGVILRDYRNYIHPYKEKSHGIKITEADAELMWDLCIKISHQLIK